MIDNSWISSDKASGSARPRSNVMKVKVTVTVLILLIGGILTVAMNGVGSNATQYQSEGIVIDFGNYDTSWTDADFHKTSDPVELLDMACEENGYSHATDASGNVTEINGYSNDQEHSWGLWYVDGSKDAVRSEGYDIDASDHTVVIWAYTTSDGVPAVAVDSTGTSIYGYAQASRTVTLSPVCTELLGAVNAVNTIVGTDSFSDYPKSVKAGHDNGTISVVGTYTDPSYESIMKLSPDMVFCDGAQYNHIQMAQSMRNSSVNAVVIYNGESVETIMKNIFIVGTAMGYGMAAASALTELSEAMDKLTSIVGSSDLVDTMISLSADPSPFVAGDDTYASDIVFLMDGNNVFSSLTGWKNINTEYIMKNNPSVIIILSSESYYSENNGSYERMLEQLSPQWKSTDAYANGRIYLLCEDLGEMSQRYGPRFAQLTEIVGRILHPEAFGDGITIPNCLGNSYLQYLTITKNLGFDN